MWTLTERKCKTQSLMLTLHLFKRAANKRGIFLLSLFCLYSAVLLIPTGRELFGSTRGGFWWSCGQFGLMAMVSVSLITPVISLFKPGFSYKGHPGKRHATLAVAGGIILLICFSIITAHFLSTNPVLQRYQMILYSLVYPLHGIHCLVVYSSLFKGPTSKFGKIYQPFLPVIE